jgi:hypothetical protein
MRRISWIDQRISDTVALPWLLPGGDVSYRPIQDNTNRAAAVLGSGSRSNERRVRAMSAAPGTLRAGQLSVHQFAAKQ